jgi:hypothetical protein
MPTYYFRNNKTNEEYSEFMSMSELDEYLKNTDIQQIPTAPAIASGRGMSKPDAGFRDVLRRIKDKHSQGISRSTINTFD